MFTFLSSIFSPFSLLADGAATTSRQGSMIQTMVMLGVAVVFFYFLMWRPERKRRKQMEQMRIAMKKGDRVTVMGILGTVQKVSETTVVLALVDGAKMEVLKGAITDVKPAQSEEKVIETTSTQ